jgi:hypothetical protein
LGPCEHGADHAVAAVGSAAPAVGACAPATGACEPTAAVADRVASAPETSRAWLLIEHPGPWAAEPVESAGLPAAAIQAAELGVRVQLIKRPGSAGTAMHAAWTAGPAVWAGEFSGDVGALAAGSDAAIREPGGPMFLVCTHGRRNACCGRYGGALARALSAAGYPVWETTHVGGHRFAANLVILPHGLYYGPVDLPGAMAALDGYRRGVVVARGLRGRAGLDAAAQRAEYAEILQSGSLDLPQLAVTMP